MLRAGASSACRRSPGPAIDPVRGLQSAGPRRLRAERLCDVPGRVAGGPATPRRHRRRPAYAFNAHTLTRFGHLQALHVQFLPLALAAFHELRERPRWQAALALAGWVSLQALTSNYLLVMTAVALLAAACVVPRAWLGPDGLRRLGFALLAASVASAVLGPFLLPYYYAKVQQGLDAAVRRGRPLLRSASRLRGHRRPAALRSVEPPRVRRIHTAVPGPDGAGPGRGAAPERAGVDRSAAPHGAGGGRRRRGAVVRGARARLPLALRSRAAAAGHARGRAFRLVGAVRPAVPRRRRPRALLRGQRSAVANAIALAAALAVTAEAARFPMGFTRHDGIPPIYAQVAAHPADVVLVELPFPDPA